MGDLQIMDMPIKRFWMFSESIDRMNSASDIRAVRVAAAVLGQETFKDTLQKLTEAVGEVAVNEFNPEEMPNVERDRDATEKLRSLMR